MITSLSDMLNTNLDELIAWLEENQYKYDLVPVEDDNNIEDEFTPCEELGYKEGDRFVVKANWHRVAKEFI